MIRIEKGQCIIAGTILETATEATMVLAAIYKNAEELIGENEAKELLVGIGRAAVDREAIDSHIISNHTYVVPK